MAENISARIDRLETVQQQLQEQLRMQEEQQKQMFRTLQDLLITMHDLLDLLIKKFAKIEDERVIQRPSVMEATTPQYPHFMVMTPTRMSLQNMEQKPNESFREYALRWRDLAVQVQPPLMEEESAVLFVDTLKAPFHDLLVDGAINNSFANMVLSGEMIERGIKNGKHSL